ncbi:ATP synthase mitochondrial F1 complex assembly factor 1 [Phlebotomus argentipes]|uniref:ATP synthase mitochondrial F1 complex assembly factor 1 n=1 Tax=Phlebotomus argentipes TaxID=94469 RepID=UPI002893660C|nr:ATP synthase mitochondrial F1 complex assembly factor 1 [Phlebotomus argentipes]
MPGRGGERRGDQLWSRLLHGLPGETHEAEESYRPDKPDAGCYRVETPSDALPTLQEPPRQIPVRQSAILPEVIEILALVQCEVMWLSEVLCCDVREMLVRRIPVFWRGVSRGVTMSASARAKEVVEELKEKNPYYEKYAEKIAKLQKTSPEEFLSRVDNLEKVKKPEKAAPEERTRSYSELLKPKESLKEKGEIPHKKLDDIMKIDLVEGKSADEIRSIWLEYHKMKDVIAAAIPTEQYDLQQNRAKSHPIFVLPIPRSQGFEFIMLQFAANSVHFTPLLCYQVHKENAPECLNIVHYTEFREKGIVLMRGEYDSQVINAQEAQCLANQLQLYYGQNSQDKLQLLETFTNQPESFKHMDVIAELENLKISTP